MDLFDGSPQPAWEAYAAFQDLEECLRRSREQTVFILKHNRTCPVSARAKQEVDAFLRRRPATVYLVVVQTERPASNAIAERLRVKHESPQVLCLRDGAVQAVFHHHQITAAALEKALQSAECHE
ncbi:MAG: bacillithiol system redox-active protein YtxJ [bacterium]